MASAALDMTEELPALSVEKERRRQMIQKTKQNTFEQLWLSYYNDTLYEKGFITEDERNKMRLKIKEYTSKKAT